MLIAQIFKVSSRMDISPFKKAVCQSSKIAPDQVHEQNNEVIKGTSGSKNHLNRIRIRTLGALPT